MTKYKSWEELQKSEDPILDAYMSLVSIDKGTMQFNFEYNGKKYFASGSNCYVSDYYWSPDDTVKTCSDFDNFWLYEAGDSFEVIEEICNW